MNEIKTNEQILNEVLSIHTQSTDFLSQISVYDTIISNTNQFWVQVVINFRKLDSINNCDFLELIAVIDKHTDYQFVIENQEALGDLFGQVLIFIKDASLIKKGKDVRDCLFVKVVNANNKPNQLLYHYSNKWWSFLELFHYFFSSAGIEIIEKRKYLEMILSCVDNDENSETGMFGLIQNIFERKDACMLLMDNDLYREIIESSVNRQYEERSSWMIPEFLLYCFLIGIKISNITIEIICQRLKEDGCHLSTRFNIRYLEMIAEGAIDNNVRDVIDNYLLWENENG